LKTDDGKGCKKINNLFKGTNSLSTVVTDNVETASAPNYSKTRDKVPNDVENLLNE
jgi:hypothetical protein